jgi:hypothetical protein
LLYNGAAIFGFSGSLQSGIEKLPHFPSDISRSVHHLGIVHFGFGDL